MKKDDIYPSKYLKAADLNGEDVTYVIAESAVEMIGDDRKLVVYFQGEEKSLVCNPTNYDRIAYFLGDETDNWPGKEVVLYAEMVNFKGKLTEAIRVKAPPKARQARPAPPGSKATGLPRDETDQRRGPKPIIQSGRRSSEPSEEDMAGNG